MTSRPTPEDEPTGPQILVAIYTAVIVAVVALHFAFPAVFL
ncbi:hypothetical protein [Sphingomonas sp. 10B4]|nr:hypothetical protein [Sphingomonas sp. 10B4]MDY7525520.1 hypothetical protein [Sphingomonas sp. 10B4]MEB0281466.1 hypothetical protein [Sphingomonas sp. 10B4]